MTVTEAPPAAPRTAPRSLFKRDLVWSAVLGSLRKLDPRVQVRNPVMFVVEVGAAISTVAWLAGGRDPRWFTFTIAVWLWLTVVFANLAEALAEGRGRAQAASLRAMRAETTARLASGEEVPASQLQRGDVWAAEAAGGSPGTGPRTGGSRGAAGPRSPA